jgi:predicted pyridoxine 5'-phosphate oxidase superfamily flavin-nucleotide-binding protein
MATTTGPFHEGERAVQRAAGEQDAARQNGAIIGDAIAGGAADFLRAQRMLVVATRDARGRPWASVLFGAAGLASARDGGRDEGHQDGRLVTIDRTLAYGSPAEMPWSHLGPGASLGLLAIDLSTRRRLRINGRVEVLSDERLVLRVEQAYPNCPKYIQRRRLRSLAPAGDARGVLVREGQTPDAALLAAVRAADTIFVASGHPSRGLDASHRGGQPGFIRVVPPDVLRIPDYAGNGMFNTLGNLAVDARCGVTVLDFTSGQLHQMTGDAILHLDAPGADDDGGDDPSLTGRSWDFRVQAWQSTALPVRADWEFLDYSPYNPS